MRSATTKIVGTAAACALVAVVIVRPWHASFSHDIPANLGDPALVIWIMRFVAHQATHHPSHLFDANIYWPHHGTLAYSEAMLSVAPIYGLWFVLSGGWAPALTLTIVTLLALNIGASYALARWLTGRTDAALIGALAFSANAYFFAHWGHLQLQTLGLIPLAFLLLFRLLERPRATTAIAFGITSAALVLGALYYGAAYAVALPIVLLVIVGTPSTRPMVFNSFRHLVLGAGVAAVLIAPGALTYLHVSHQPGYNHALESGWGLRPLDLIRPAPGSYVYSGLQPSPRAGVPWEHRFFLGFTALALASVGAVALIRRSWLREPTELTHRRVQLRALCIAGIATGVLAIGPIVHGHSAPYRFFHDHVPGFAGMRVTARLAVVSLLAVSMLAAAGASTIIARLRSHRPAWLLAGAAVALMALEYSAPLPWVRLPDDRATLAVYKTLASRPPGAVAELPMVDLRVHGTEWAFAEAPRMVYSTLDWHPRVNGYSGFTPPDYFSTIDAFSQFPAPEALDAARRLGVRYVVVHLGGDPATTGYTEADVLAMRTSLPSGTVMTRQGDSYLVELPR